MTIKTVARFSIDYIQYLNAKGEWVQKTLPAFAKHPATLIRLYQGMQLTRAFDKKAIALQRTGRLGTFPSSLGQEAISVGIGFAMADHDVLCPYYREHGALFQRKVSLKEVFAYWGGDERGNCYEDNPYDFPVSVPIASQCLHAAGVAFAFQYRQQKRVAVCVCGDGATSEGDFYEAMNVAGAWHLPVVFVVNNNQWAISVSRDKQTAASTLAQKAIAAGFEGLQIDGNDIISVVALMKRALSKARKGQGPTLLEMLTYRLSDHTTADDASRYVNPKAIQQAFKQDPVSRLFRYLVKAKYWSLEKDAQLQQDCNDQVQKAAQAYLAMQPQPSTHLFDYLYATLPKALRQQYAEVSQATLHSPNSGTKEA